MGGGTGYRPGPQTEALRQIVGRNYYRDAAGRLRRRTADDGGLPPSSSAIVSPYDTTARYVRHGHIIRWKGFSPYRDAELERLHLYGRYLLNRLPRRADGGVDIGEVDLSHMRVEKTGEYDVSLTAEGPTMMQGFGDGSGGAHPRRRPRGARPDRPSPPGRRLAGQRLDAWDIPYDCDTHHALTLLVAELTLGLAPAPRRTWQNGLGGVRHPGQRLTSRRSLPPSPSPVGDQGVAPYPTDLMGPDDEAPMFHSGSAVDWDPGRGDYLEG